MLLTVSLIFLNSCSKSDDPSPEPPAGSGFTAADFKLTIDKFYEPGDDYGGEDYLRIEYTIKNISSRRFERGMKLHWKVKAADGAYYETIDENLVYFDPLNAGASMQTASVIKLGTPNNHADKSTLTYVMTP